MAADTASTSENSPSHSVHSQNSFSSPETPEPIAKRLKTDTDVTFHQLRSADHHSVQTDARAIHQSGKFIPVCVAQPIRRERSEEDSFRTKPVVSSPNVCYKPSIVKNCSALLYDDVDSAGMDHRSCGQQDTKEEYIDGAPPLPSGKKHHIFVSHCTGDKSVVRERLVLPLRDSCGFNVSACYHFMPDETRYDDKGIFQALNSSCVIIIALSNAYTRSERCVKEYNQAVGIEKEKKCHVIVAAIASCSRPTILKSFLYLDFIEQAKSSTVWTMLLETINKTLKTMTCDPILPKVEPVHKEMVETYVPEDPKGHGCYPEQEEGEELSSEHMSPLPRGHQALDRDREASLLDGDGSVEWQWGGEKAEDAAVREQECVEEGVDSDEEEKTKDMEEGEVSGSSPEKQDKENQAHKVTSFYNKLAEPNADKRNESPIYHMRNFNNWVKSILIRTYLPKRATVLDLCCGKGGDLLKWKEGNIEYLVCADISDASVEHCQGRYQSKKMAFNNQPPYGAEFLVADCSEERLREKYRNAGRRFHLTSCQFSLHYAFESYEKARMMLRNACENLLPGGYFIGTTVDSNELVRKLREAGPSKEGTYQIENEIFSVRAGSLLNQCLDLNQAVPLFGAKYNFRLHEVVDLPEYLIHMPLLSSMLSDFGMELITQQNFHDFFTDHRHKPEDLSLLFRMQAFSPETGTMSPAQWEVIGLYLVFVFRRRGFH